MAAQQQQQGGDNSLAPLWITAGIFLLALAFWYFAHAQIVAVVLKIRIAEADLISLFASSVLPLKAAIHAIPPSNYLQVSFNQLIDISNSIGSFLRYPVALILAVLAVVLYFSNASARYRKTYSMQRLLDEEKNDWPQIMPITKLDLVEEDIDKGPWAMSMSPMQFAKKHNLLRLEKIITSDAMLTNQAKIVASIQRDEAHRIFALQLGRFWLGVENLNIYTQALFAIFAARVGGDKKGSVELTRQIAASTVSGKLDFSGVKELLTKHKNNKQVIKVTQKHAYALTVMASLLQLARQDGVLASADFLWLKPVDRALWFMLNNVGRHTPVTEVAGPFAHWLAELEFGKKLFVPMVDEAVNALDIAVKEQLYVEEDEEQEQVQQGPQYQQINT